jgi:DNA modification methylase
MSNINIYNGDNLKIGFNYDIADLVYADMVYENHDLRWLWRYWSLLKHDGIMIIQTDHHTIMDVWKELDTYGTRTFVNHLVWKNEWGNYAKDRFHQCFDDILIFCKGKDWKFYPERIQVPKATAKTNLNPSGRETKPATAWIDDVCLTTTSKERVKKADGHLVKWQKPMKLFDRIILPFTDEGDNILDPFMGIGSLEKWSLLNNRNCIGIEIDKEIFELAKVNIYG